MKSNDRNLFISIRIIVIIGGRLLIVGLLGVMLLTFHMRIEFVWLGRWVGLYRCVRRFLLYYFFKCVSVM